MDAVRIWVKRMGSKELAKKIYDYLNEQEFLVVCVAEDGETPGTHMLQTHIMELPGGEAQMAVMVDAIRSIDPDKAILVEWEEFIQDGMCDSDALDEADLDRQWKLVKDDDSEA